MTGEVQELPATSTPWSIARRGLLLLPSSVRRRVLQAVAGAAVMAALEAASFALLFFLIRVVSDPEATLPAFASTLGATGERDAFLARAGALTMTLLLARAFGSFLLLRVQARVQAEADAALATALFRSYIGTSYSAFIQRNSAEMTTNIAYRVPDVAGNSVGAVIALAGDVAVLLGVLITLVAVQPLLAAGVAAYFLLVALGLLRVLTPAVRRTSFREATESTAAQQLLQEGLGGFKAIKANELAGFFVERFAARRDSLRAVRQRRVFLARLPTLYLETSLFIGLGILAVAVFRFDRDAAVATFGLLAAASLRVLPTVGRVLGALTGIRASEASLAAVEADTQRDRRQLQGQSQGEGEGDGSLHVRRCLEVENLTFRYPTSSESALKRISFRVAAGEAIGLVGGSGAGKTTLVDVLLGLLDPTSGRLLVDGTTISSDNVGAWRRSIGYVPQDVFLLDATLRENILFGRHGSAAELAEAVALAQLDDVITRLPAGLESMVGERGVRLSGGQRQRIGIARALLPRPTLLILDEATSALDNKTEAAVTRSIAGLRGRTTTLVIAHRLSTVKSCDRIFFLDNGELTASGSFAELQRSSDRFSELVRLGQLDAPENGQLAPDN